MDSQKLQEELKKRRFGYQKLDRYRETWTEENDLELAGLFNEGYGISEIAVTMGRSERAVFQRLSTQKRFKQMNRQKRERQECNCLCEKCPSKNTCEKSKPSK